MTNKATLTACATLMLAIASNAQAAKPMSGAIFTTDIYGSIVNENTQYLDKCDVFLDGGPPPNAKKMAAGLPDGDYYFQVTDPSGRHLLSTDPVMSRIIHIEGGLIVSSGGHVTNGDMDHGGSGAVVVGLCPYDDTPDDGGVYKVWVTPAGDATINGGGFVGDPMRVENDCGPGCFHGFLPSRSKTDNFKVEATEETFCLNVFTQIQNSEIITAGVNWQISVTGPLGAENTYVTDEMGFAEVCNLTAGSYSVSESPASEEEGQYNIVSSLVNGTPIDPPTETLSIVWNSGDTDPQVLVWVNATQTGPETEGETGGESEGGTETNSGPETCGETLCDG